MRIVKVIQTCVACPSQWDAWDDKGNYWYLRFRHGEGTAETQQSPDYTKWDRHEPEFSFSTDRDEYSGFMTLEEFCRFADIELMLDG